MWRTIAMSIVLVAAVVLLAGATTTFDSTWNGVGTVQHSYNAGDDYSASFTSFGSAWNVGQFHATDKDDNPYNYGVDSCSAYVQVGVGAAGGSDAYLEFIANRLDSKSSMYGPAGQTSTSQIWTDGTAEMAFGNSMNYASCADCEYGWRSKYGATTNGYEFEATGNFDIFHQIEGGGTSNDFAYVYNVGSGSSMMKLMGSTAGGSGSGYNMGHLPVCGDGEAWDNNYAKFVANGIGNFGVYAVGTNYVGVHEGGLSIPGSGDGVTKAIYDLSIQYSGSWTYADFGVKGD